MTSQIHNFLNIIKYAINKENNVELPELSGHVHWDVLSKLAMRHNLLAIFHEVAYNYSEYKEYFGYEENLQIALVTAAKQIQKTERFLELYQAFLREDLHPIVMKGIVCRQLYGQYAEHRYSVDEDILVQKKDFDKIRTVMEQNGFVCLEPNVTQAQLETIQEVGFYEKTSGLYIEVHTNIMGHKNQLCSQMGACFKDVFEHVQVLQVSGIPISTMSHSEHYLFLVLHAFKHFSMRGVGIRQVLDILSYQRKYEMIIDWEWVENALKENHADGYLGDLQFIGVHWLGFDLGVQFKTCTPDILLEDIMQGGIFGRNGEAEGYAASINLFTNNKEKRRISTWICVIFPSKKYMVQTAHYLQEKPWYLPIEWVKRWERFIKRARKYDGNLLVDSIKQSKKRKKILKKYGF